MAPEIWVNIGSCNGLLLDGTKPLPEPLLTNDQWGVVFTWKEFHRKYLRYISLKWVWLPPPLSLSKIWSSWRSTFCDVITTCKYSSVHSVPDVLIVLFRGPVVFIWCQSPGCSLCKRIYCLSWAYLERKSQIWPYIYNQRKQSSSTYFENERSGSQLSIWKHLVCNITAILHNVYVKYIYSGMPL